MIPVIKEGTGFEIEVHPLDGEGNEVPVNSAEYRIDDLSSGQNVLPWTEAEELSPILLKVSPSETVMIDETRRTERRLITVIAHFGTDGQITEEFYFKVKNLRFIPKN